MFQQKALYEDGFLHVSVFGSIIKMDNKKKKLSLNFHYLAWHERCFLLKIYG